MYFAKILFWNLLFVCSAMHLYQHFSANLSVIFNSIVIIINNSENNRIFAENMNSNGTNRSAEESKQFPHFLGEYGEEAKASRVLEIASANTSTGGGRDETEGTVQNSQLLLTIEREAKKYGIWIDNPNVLVSEQIGYGQENTVYISKDGENVIKFNDLKYLNDEDDIVRLIDRINAYNQFAKDVPYTVLGFTKDQNGGVGLLLQQPYVQGTMEADQYTIDTYLQKVGYSKQILSNGRKGWANDAYEIWDVVPRNVLMDVYGNLYFIDININSRVAKSSK